MKVTAQALSRALTDCTVIKKTEQWEPMCAGHFDMYETTDGVFLDYYESDDPCVERWPDMASLERGEQPIATYR